MLARLSFFVVAAGAAALTDCNHESDEADALQ